MWTIAELGTLVRVDSELSQAIATIAAERSLSAYDAADVAGSQVGGCRLLAVILRLVFLVYGSELPGPAREGGTGARRMLQLGA